MNILETHGRTSCQVGLECLNKDVAWHASTAQEIHNAGFNSAIVKVHDGENRWYADKQFLLDLRQTYLQAGVGFIPFGYCYGPKFGDAQIDGEAALIQEICAVYEGQDTFYVADMEAEYNGETTAAQRFLQALQGLLLPFAITTFADPLYQNWKPILDIFDPFVCCWLPQRYSTWLAGQLFPVSKPCLPIVDLTTEFGPNNPVAIAEHTPYVSVWEYQQIAVYPAEVQAIIKAKKGNPAPLPPPPGHGLYTVVAGDTLSLIASRFNVDEHALYEQNKTLIEATANAHGFANSNNGNWIFPGEVLSI